ncbi:MULTISPECIES: hypothetical protein [Burkholderiaceae]|jgi:hypothetical protein|uniref:hypothetical protein n=1 Tax=Burkholderiaceae TaxID=119060 RepID=UPI000D06EDA5|nr:MULTISPECIES: hypothetical protein [Burkholderiaceae]MBU9366417.1 hypothetical protein [Burkholderia multivorans]PRZ43841.1 hypothetical protein BX589_14921 [Paraburkholderia fungorum]
MFLPVQFQSVNHAGLLQAGEYHASCRTYTSRDRASTMLYFEYRRPEDELVSACDVVLIDRKGAVRACDFLRMADRSWRDSFGARADSLLALLPGEVAHFELVDEARLGALHVREAE